MAIVGGEYMEQFEAFFRMADFNHDGRISGNEAAAFFQGSNLPRQVLAQVWMHADQNQTGYLSLPAFYNALKLVTVAQSNKELTHDIVKGALYGPDSAKIPAPEINLPAISAPQPNLVAAFSGNICTISALAPNPIDQLSTLSTSAAEDPKGLVGSGVMSNQQTPSTVTSSLSPSGVPNSIGNPTPEQSHNSWPKMTHVSVQQYAKVFVEVDSDRDGKITGGQARVLFLSWRLPRVVLKQIWDLSDEDNDGILSFREFCIALYLMERYREGATLPSTLPESIKLDETLLSLAGPPFTRSMETGPTQFNEQTARVPVVGEPQLIINGDDNYLDTKGQEATETSEKYNQVSVVGEEYMEMFEAYFQMADLDRNGRISGNEAVAFFEGSNLPREILAQVWMHADQNQTGFLRRPAFYNALKLVSVAQSRGKLTPDIVKAALYGPASAKIAAPYINIAAISSPQPNQMAATPGVEPSTGVQAPVETPYNPFGIPDSTGSSMQELAWQKMIRVSTQKYAKFFEEVDTDGDGKITMDQARNLFLSGRLPRDAFEQFWYLIYRDSDDRLGLKEFCIALYLMETGARLSPSTFPDSVMLDETLLSLAGPPIIGDDNSLDTNGQEATETSEKESDRGEHEEQYFFGTDDLDQGSTFDESIHSTRGFDYSSNFSFDDSDPFGSSAPFKVSTETPKKDSE